MTSPLVPTAKLELGGKVYSLRLDLNALADFEVMTGKSILRGGLTDIANLELSDVRGLLWAMMVQDDESVTIREVGRMIHVGNITDITEVITELVAGTMPTVREGEADTDPLTPGATTPSPIENGGSDSTPPADSISE